MKVHPMPLDISLPDDLLIDLWLVQWHTPTPPVPQPIEEDYRSQKADLLRQLPELLRRPAKTAPADRLAVVVFPEISLPRDHCALIEELLNARAKPTIVVAGFEHLTWAHYKALLKEMSDTPEPETCDPICQASTFVNAAGIWIRDRLGQVRRYLQLKRHPADVEQTGVRAGQNVLVFKSNDQGNQRRLNFCVQICSDFCSRAFVTNLRQAIDSTPALRGRQLDLLILPQHHGNRKAMQFRECFDAYFGPSVQGSQTDTSCIIVVNNSAPDHGKSDKYGESGLCFPHGRWRSGNPPATYWMRNREDHQAVIVREAGPGAYYFLYKPHCYVNRRPGSGQATPFSGNNALFASIAEDDARRLVFSPACPLPAEAHWLVSEWRSHRGRYQVDLEANLPPGLPEAQRVAISNRCDQAHGASFLQWKNHVKDHPEAARWMLYSYLSCWATKSAYPPTKKEPHEWRDCLTPAVEQFLECYSLLNLATAAAIEPYHDQIVHARWGDAVGVFFLWGDGRKSAQAMILKCKSRLPPVAPIAGPILLVLVNPQGTPTRGSLKRDLRFDEAVVTGLETVPLPKHLRRDGTVTRTQGRNSLNLVGSHHLWDKVHSATDEDDLVKGLEKVLSEELATCD